MHDDRRETVHEAGLDGPRNREEAAGGWYDRGYLPHYDGRLTTQTATFRLADSLPHDVARRWMWELRDLPSDDARTRCFHRIEKCLDTGLGACHLREPQIGRIVQDTLLFFDEKRYVLHAWVIMPNHVHTLFTPFDGERVDKILHSWKSFTAKKANRILRRHGSFWQRESYDRYIRDEAHFLSVVRYIEENPVMAGLCESREEWEFSSAYGRRRDHGTT